MTAVNFVPPEGPRSAKIAFVGEAPGEAENRMLRPFVGASGQLLDQLLQSVGLLRRDVYLTNVVKEQPPGNQISRYISLTTSRASTTKRYDEMEQLLYDELAQVQANVIVPLGNVSLWALTRQKAITKRRGSILVGDMIGGRKVIPTLHPAAALRQYLWRYYMVHDLQRIVEESAYPDIRLPSRELIIRPSFDDAMSYLRACHERQTIGVDIEVNMKVLEMSCIAIADSPERAISIPFMDEHGEYFTPPQEAAIMVEIARHLESPTIQKIGQNFKFDMGFLHNRFGIRTINYDCTMIAQAILQPDFPKGLDFITSIYTREPYYKDEGKTYFKLGLDLEQFWRYNAKDAIVCLEAFPKQLNDLSRQGNVETYERQKALIDSLLYMETLGIRTDVAGLRDASLRADLAIHKLTIEIAALAGVPLNPNSPTQLREYFYVTKGLKPYVNRKTGKATTDVTALKRIARQGHKEALLLLDHRKLVKLNGTYYKIKVSADGRLRGSFNPVGTTSGRLSSSKNIFGEGGNLQNIPKAVRCFLVADPGYILFDVDLAQAENRTVAYIAPEETMIHAFETGIDVHSLTASAIFGKPVGEISRAEGSCAFGNGKGSERDWGKKANHAFNYALGEDQFSLMYECTIQEAKRIRAGYFAKYPGVLMYHAWVRAQLNRDRTLTTPFGRRRKFLASFDNRLLNVAYSFIPQSLVGEIMNQWGLRFAYESPYFERAQLLNQIHDSLVFQFPVSLGWTAIARALLALQTSLQQAIVWRTRQFAIPADLQMGKDMYHLQKIDWRSTGVELLAERLESAYVSLGEVRPQAPLDTSDISIDDVEAPEGLLLE